jgi:hypothetical protein
MARYKLLTESGSEYKLSLRGRSWYLHCSGLDERVFALADREVLDGRMNPERFERERCSGALYEPVGVPELDVPQFRYRMVLFGPIQENYEAFARGVKVLLKHTSPVEHIELDAPSGTYVAVSR